MIYLQAMFSGNQLGEALRDDPEELAQALTALADGDPDLCDDVEGHLQNDDRNQVAAFLQRLLTSLST